MLIYDYSGFFGMVCSLFGSLLGIGMILLLLVVVLVCWFIYLVMLYVELFGKVFVGVVVVVVGCDFVFVLLLLIYGFGGVFGVVLGLFGDFLVIVIKVFVVWVLLVLMWFEVVLVLDDEDFVDFEVVQDGFVDCFVVVDEVEGLVDGDEVSWFVGVGVVWMRVGDVVSGVGVLLWDQNDVGGGWMMEVLGFLCDELDGQVQLGSLFEYGLC